ncbi:thermonuclease family protein [Devosia rhodophyticola]|uniref:Thermonuclease family protein n=1 Tax=Devosia rhodophyticola TaxID=3026423 RepID=A0ABY7Z008_9HYPH|nr:thermonuclease family protein [Devosia rhodophyticola]WDR06360.1 thermonuclease family protein [Devosia rhodophyticola]
MPSYSRKSRLFSGRRGAVVAVMILVAFAVIAARLEPPSDRLSGQLRASDGDSFHFGSDRVRLLGIDSPELAQTCLSPSGAQWACGKRAREQLETLLLGQVSCAQSSRDRFDRVLANCQSDGRDIGAVMVSQGLAVATEGYNREQSSARAAKRGIWAGTFENPRAWRDRHPR